MLANTNQSDALSLIHGINSCSVLKDSAFPTLEWVRMGVSLLGRGIGGIEKTEPFICQMSNRAMMPQQLFVGDDVVWHDKVPAPSLLMPCTCGRFSQRRQTHALQNEP